MTRALARWLGAAVAIALVAVAAFAVAPSSASAFVGEGTVLNPSKTDLTGPAKTIIEKPTFLPDTEAGAGALGGVPEASGAASVFEASTLLPALGAFGLGAVIGSEICHVVGIEGCWQLTGTTPSETATGYHWEYKEAAGTYPWTWRWTRGQALYNGVDGFDCMTGSDYPVLADYFAEGTESSGECIEYPKPFESYTAHKVQPLRHSMKERSLAYSATDTAMPNYEPGGEPYEASSKWSEKMASALKEQPESTPAGRLGEHIASKIEGSGVADPYPHEVAVPDCSGLKKAACVGLLEELELVPEVTELDWDEAVIEELEELEPEKTREEESERIIEISPPVETTVKTGSEVELTTNPEEGDMPEFVPKPDPGETGDEFKERKFGLPLWAPHVTTLDDATLDPSKGPEEVARTNPSAGTRVDPHAAEGSQTVDIQQNPSDVPVPASGGWTPPTIPALDLSPLTGLGSPCTVFPFGLFCWVGEGISQFDVSGECPEAEVPVPAIGGGEPSVFSLGLCGETSEILLGYIRPVLLFAFIVGCGFLFARGTKAIGDD